MSDSTIAPVATNTLAVTGDRRQRQEHPRRDPGTPSSRQDAEPPGLPASSSGPADDPETAVDAATLFTATLIASAAAPISPPAGPPEAAPEDTWPSPESGLHLRDRTV